MWLIIVNRSNKNQPWKDCQQNPRLATKSHSKSTQTYWVNRNASHSKFTLTKTETEKTEENKPKENLLLLFVFGSCACVDPHNLTGSHTCVFVQSSCIFVEHGWRFMLLNLNYNKQCLHSMDCRRWRRFVFAHLRTFLLLFENLWKFLKKKFIKKSVWKFMKHKQKKKWMRKSPEKNQFKSS